jgi:thiol-disulfide isomerase/thioredoxin
MIRHSLKAVFLAITLITMLSFMAPFSETIAFTLSEDDVSFELIFENRTTSVNNILDYKSSITILEFFSPECGHCSNQIPELDELRAHFTLSELTLISLSLFPETYSVDFISDYRDDNEITWFIGRDLADLWHQFNLTHVPTFLWFHSNGSVFFDLTVGYRTFTSLFDQVNESLTLLEEDILGNYTSTSTTFLSSFSSTTLLFSLGVVLVPLFLRKRKL